MGTLAALLAQAGPRKPWEEGEGVVPAQPIQRVDPAALAASQASQSASAPMSIADMAMLEAERQRQRQEAFAQAGQPSAETLQSVPLGTTQDPGVLAMLKRLIAEYLGEKPQKEKGKKP